MYSKKKKLLFTINSLDGGGAERVTLNLLRNLDPRKYEIELFLIKNQGVLREEVPKEIKLIQPKSKGKLKTFFQLLKISKFADIIIGVDGAYSLFFSFLIGRVLNKKTITWIHTSFPFYINEKKYLIRFFYWFLLKNSKNIIFVSKGAKESSEKWLRGTKKSNKVIYNLMDLELLNSLQENLEYEEVFKNTKVIIAAGRLVQLKGFDLLIRAHAKVLEKGIDHKLFIMGEGPERKNLELLVKSLNIENSVFLPGFISNPLPILKKGKAFVLSSHFEGLGMVLLEALSVGLPIISTDCPHGPREILKDGKFGTLIQPNNLDELSGAIIEVLQSPNESEDVKELKKVRVEEFLPEKIIPKWENLFG